MNPPAAVRETAERTPLKRMHNVPVDITPHAVEDFDYYPYSVAVGFSARYLSVWAFPWWLSDRESAPHTGGFSTGFASGFEGGADSPQGAGFERGFSSGFGQ